jgi:hypothetical protein
MTKKLFHHLQLIPAATSLKNHLSISVPSLPTLWVGGECCFVEICCKDLRTDLISTGQLVGPIKVNTNLRYAK